MPSAQQGVTAYVLAVPVPLDRPEIRTISGVHTCEANRSPLTGSVASPVGQRRPPTALRRIAPLPCSISTMSPAVARARYRWPPRVKLRPLMPPAIGADVSWVAPDATPP